MKKCFTDKCKNNAQDKHKLCAPCRYEKQKKDDIFKRTWFTLKSNCKRRGVECNLTLEEFTAFVKPSNYIAEKGIDKCSLQLVRKDTTKGYSIDNVKFAKNPGAPRKQKPFVFTVDGHTPSDEIHIKNENEPYKSNFHEWVEEKRKVVTTRSYLWGLIKVTVTK